MKRNIISIFVFMVIVTLSVSTAFACPPAAEKTDKTGILLVTFGSSYPEAQRAFDNIDEKARAAFPDTEIRWAWTSRMIRNIMAERGTALHSPEQALAEMADEGFTHVAVQSLHVIMGSEFHYLKSVAKAFESMGKGIENISVGMPLLADQRAMEMAANAVKSSIPPERNVDDAVVLVGHGTAHPANAFYTALMWQLQQTDKNIFIGTLSGFPDEDVILDILKKNGIEKVWLMPFMSVAGDHVQNDMFSEDEDSWQSIFEEAGIESEAVNKGFAEYDVYVDIWIKHLEDALSKL